MTHISVEYTVDCGMYSYICILIVTMEKIDQLDKLYFNVDPLIIFIENILSSSLFTADEGIIFTVTYM